MENSWERVFGASWAGAGVVSCCRGPSAPSKLPADTRPVACMKSLAQRLLRYSFLHTVTLDSVFLHWFLTYIHLVTPNKRGKKHTWRLAPNKEEKYTYVERRCPRQWISRTQTASSGTWPARYGKEQISAQDKKQPLHWKRKHCRTINSSHCIGSGNQCKTNNSHCIGGENIAGQQIAAIVLEVKISARQMTAIVSESIISARQIIAIVSEAITSVRQITAIVLEAKTLQDSKH